MPSVDNDLPILFKSNATKSKVIYPDKNGNMVLKHKEKFKLSCGRGNKFVTPMRYGPYELDVKCLNGTFIQYRNYTYTLDVFRCKTAPMSTMRITQKTCKSVNYNVVEVGFQTKTAFLLLYRICFDSWNKNTLYTWHFVNAPLYKLRQKPKLKPKFSEPVLFNKVDILSDYANQVY